MVEGIRWLRDLVAMEQTPQVVCFTERWHDDSLLAQTNARKLLVSDSVMAAMSDVETPSGILMVVPRITRPLPQTPNFLLIFDRIQTPGNLGTMLRTAAAAGVDGVIFAPGCVDAFNPKVLRGSMGAHLRLGMVSADWTQIAHLTHSLTVYSAIIDSPHAYTNVDWRRPAALIVGNEANGIGVEAQHLSTGITIPMAANTESLNAAMAAGVILFEAVRQRQT